MTDIIPTALPDRDFTFIEAAEAVHKALGQHTTSENELVMNFIASNFGDQFISHVQANRNGHASVNGAASHVVAQLFDGNWVVWFDGTGHEHAMGCDVFSGAIDALVFADAMLTTSFATLHEKGHIAVIPSRIKNPEDVTLQGFHLIRQDEDDNETFRIFTR